MNKKILFVLAFFFGISPSVCADKWQTVGARAMGMGGVGVATANGSDGQYWNPASLAEITGRDSNIALNVTAEIEATEKVLTVIDKLSKMTDKYKDIVNAIDGKDYATAEEMSAIAEGLSALNDLSFNNIGAVAGVNAGLGTKFKKLAISVRSFVNAGITPIVDTQNIGLGIGSSGTDIGIKLGDTTAPSGEENQASAAVIADVLDKHGLTDSFASLLGLSGATSQEIGNSIVNMAAEASATEEQIAEMAKIIEEELPKAENIIKLASTGSYKDNKTQILVDANVFTELSVGYGAEVIKGLQVGANVKAIQGQMAQTGIMVLDENQNIGDAIDKALKDTKSSTQFGIDLGVLLDVEKFLEADIPLDPKFGITARNINSPQFERPDKPLDPQYADLQWNTEKYDLGRQVRAGIAVSPLNKLIVACDVDVLANETFVKNFDSQDLAFGLEYSVLNKKALTLPLRAGINKNISNSKSHLEYTAGFGIYSYNFTFEFAGGLSSQVTTVDGTTVPASASCALSIGVVF